MSTESEPVLSRSNDDESPLLSALIRSFSARDKLFAQALESQAAAVVAQANATRALTKEVSLLRGDVVRLAPSPRLVAAGFGTIVASGVLVIVLLVLGSFALRGVDIEALARATRTTMDAVPSAVPSAVPTGPASSVD